MSLINLFEPAKRALFNARRQVAQAVRHRSRPYNIVFYGIGNAAWEGIKAICNSPYDLFDLPIGNLFLVGRDEEGSTTRRERLAIEADIILARNRTYSVGNKIQVIPRSDRELGDLLSGEDIDLFFFTADKNPGIRDNRIRTAKNNIEIVDSIAEYFTEDFNGLINFVSNLPEVLAHRAALKFKLKDIRQITAHVPLDLIRYQELIRREFEGEHIEDMNLAVAGYHDRIWPIVNNCYITTGYIERTGEPSIPIIKEIAGRIQNFDAIVEDLEDFANKEIDLLKRERDAYKKKHDIDNLVWKEAPTSASTGMAILELLGAFVNKTSTTTAIPSQIEPGKYFFVDIPVTFEEGPPLLDRKKYGWLTEDDLHQLKDRIIGVQSKEGTLEKVVTDCIGKDCDLEVDESEAASKKLIKMFNPAGSVTPSSDVGPGSVLLRESEVPHIIEAGKQKLEIPSDLEVRLFSRNTDGNRTVLVHDLFKTKFVNEIQFPNADEDSWIVGIKEKGIDVFALLGKEKDKKIYDYILYSIDSDSLNPTELCQITTQLITDFDYHDGNMFYTLEDKSSSAVRVYDIKSKKELNPYTYHSGKYMVVRVFPLSKGTSIVSLKENELYSWKKGKRKEASFLGYIEPVPNAINALSFQGVDLISFGRQGYGHIKKISENDGPSCREFLAKNTQIGLSADENSINAFVINPNIGLERWYTPSIDVLLNNDSLEYEQARVDELGSNVLNGLITGIRAMKNSVVVVGNGGYLLFEKDPLRFIKSFQLENAGKTHWATLQKS